MKDDGRIRVLIVDESDSFRDWLSRELGTEAGIQVVPGARDAQAARDRILQHHPSVILLDLDLPGSDGLAFVRNLREHYPVPVFAYMGSSVSGAPRALQALEAGVLEVFKKPRFGTRLGRTRFKRDLLSRLRTAATDARPVPSPAVNTVWEKPTFASSRINSACHLVAIGASTGGTEALRALLSNVPADFPPVVIVQHMPAGFTRSFAERLNHYSPLAVREARNGEAVQPGEAFIARGDTHLVVRRRGASWIVSYTNRELVNRHCPSVDVLFASAAEAAGRSGVGILLTGMGADGAKGLLAMRRAGALTLAQDQRSCVVYGMPKVAVDLGAVVRSAPPEELPDLVRRGLLNRLRKGNTGTPATPVRHARS